MTLFNRSRLLMGVLLGSLLLVNAAPAFSQARVDRIEPPNWWVGMKWSPVQLMVYGQNLDVASAGWNSPFLKVTAVTPTQSKGYVFVDVTVSPETQPGTYTLTLTLKDGKKLETAYEFRRRESGEGKYAGFSQKDIVYLITPDRFANGDPSNDVVAGYKNELNRKDGLSRHGGDIQGILNNLDYMKDLGVTAVWINPLIENNGNISYHGYSATDLYKVDPRFGTNELYRKLVDEARKKGLKIILDHVNNHIGINHPWVKNYPFPDWINGTPDQYVLTRHIKSNLTDLYQDSASVARERQGWFVFDMPDMNQRNPFLATYLIQNTLWWIEYLGIDGIREDTFPYVFQEYQARWVQSVLTEYPSFNIVGEVWIEDPVYVSLYQKDSPVARLNTHMPSVTDFGLYGATKEIFGGEKSFNRLYETLTQDFLYANPALLLTFLDNHDLPRVMYQTGEKEDQAKMGITVLMTLRGIPQIYYGTELGFVGGQEHGDIRAEMPGGWAGDKRSVFTAAGRTETETCFYTLTKALIQLRKDHPALTDGGMVHFRPEDNVYTFIRHQDQDRILVSANNNRFSRTLKLSQVAPHLRGAVSLTDALTGEVIPFSPAGDVSIPGYTARVFVVK